MSQLEKLQLRIPEEKDSRILEDILESAMHIILGRRHPLGDFPVDEEGNLFLENRYQDLQVRIAIELYNKRGAEGQMAHTENDVTRTYESASVSSSLLNEITPLGVVL